MESEKEQLEALKKWWQEYGRMAAAGLILGLGGVFGWTSWRAYVEGQAEIASLQYEQLIGTALARNYAEAMRQADVLIEEFSDSGYAPLAALVGAHSAEQENRREQAKRHLRWAMAHGAEVGVADIARLRLARILLDEGAHDEAIALAGATATEEYLWAGEELRGDVLLARGNPVAAREAYAAALAMDDIPEQAVRRLELKLDDLAARDAR